MNDPKQILVEREGRVARVTINRPERRNAVSFAAWQSLAAAFENLAADPEVRVVVLTGAGDRAFCAGNDISEFAEKRSTPEQVAAYDARDRARLRGDRGVSRNPLSPGCGARRSAAGSSSCSSAISGSRGREPGSR